MFIDTSTESIPKPISDSVMNVLITFVKNSGVVVATAMNVAAARSYKSTKRENRKANLIKCDGSVSFIECRFCIAFESDAFMWSIG